MARSLKVLWSEVAKAVERSSAETSADLLRDVQKAISGWRGEILSEGYGKTGALKIFLDDEIGSYPLGLDAPDLDAVKRRFTSFEPSSGKTVIESLENILWELCTAKISSSCEGCGEEELEVLMDPNTGELLYACSVCTYVIQANGKPWNGMRGLVPAPKSQVPR